MATPPTTLLELAVELQERHDGARQAAQQDLIEARDALARARGKDGQEGHTLALAQTRKEIAALRARLPAAKTRADAEKLLERIAAREVDERRQLAQLLDDADGVALASARADAASAFLAAVTRRAATLPAEQKAARTQQDLRDRWKAAAAAPPLKKLGHDADQLLKVRVPQVEARIVDQLKDVLQEDPEPAPTTEPEPEPASGPVQAAGDEPGTGAADQPAQEPPDGPASEGEGEGGDEPPGGPGEGVDAPTGTPKPEPSDKLYKLYKAALAGREVERQRWQDAIDALKHAESRLVTETTTYGGPGETVPLLRQALANADADLREWAEQARQRYDAAAAQLDVILQDGALLTPAEHNALYEARQAGAAAAVLLETREAARRQLLAARTAWDEAVAAARAAAPWADVSGEEAVGKARKKLDEERESYDKAAERYGAADQATYGAWAGNVPEEAWQKVAGFVEAKVTLAELAADRDRVAADTTAEQNLATALWDAEMHALKAAFLRAQAAYRGAALDRAATTRPARLAAALRGDA